MPPTVKKENRSSALFLMIFIVLAAGILAGGYLAYRNYENSYRTEKEHQLSSIAELKINQLVQWRKERLGDAKIFYRNSAFSSLVKRYFENQNDINAKIRIQRWMEQIAMAYSYNRICLHDIKGTEWISYPGGKIHPPSSFFNYSTEAIRSGKVIFQDFYKDENDQCVYLSIFIPIQDETDTLSIIGYMAMRIDPAVYLYPFIQKWPIPSKTSETLIIRQDGENVLFLNELRFQKNASLNLRFSPDSKDLPAMMAVLGQEGTVEGIDYRGEEVIASIHAVPESPWFLVAKTDKAEIYATLRERLWLLIFLIITLLFGSGAGLGMVWRQQQSHFYKAQYDAAEALQEKEKN